MYKNISDILPNKLTNDIENNIRLIKRKLNIYNLQNESNYKLEDYGIDIIYNEFENEISIFYFHKKINTWFDSDKLDVYKDNYLKASQFLKETLEECKTYKHKNIPNSIFLFKEDKFILKQSSNFKQFWLSDELIWSKLKSKFDYEWIEISNLCNDKLEQRFKQREFITAPRTENDTKKLEQAFKQREFTTIKYGKLE